jgi:transmembrane sensor
VLTLHTKTQVNVRFAADSRTIELERGQLFLTATRNPERPFFVTTQRGSVRVIGTQFAVDYLEQDLRVTVVEGQVGLLPNTTETSDPFMILSKNQQILFSEAVAGKSAVAVDARKATHWTTGRLMFEGTPLIDVVAILNQHLSKPIHIASAALEQKRIVGAISIKDPKAAAESLAAITGAIVEENTSKSSIILNYQSH